MNNEIIIDNDFDYSGYQVVRGEFFAHLNEPAIILNNETVNLNSACINKLPDVKYIHFLVNPTKKKLIVKPCLENEKDAFLWCSVNSKSGKKRPRYMKCKVFCGKLFTLMNWNSEHKYKLTGNLICSRGEYIFLFDLTNTEVFKRLSKDGEKIRNSRVPVFPEEWKDRFGLPVDEHKKTFCVNVFDGYVVFGVEGNKTEGQMTNDE